MAPGTHAFWLRLKSLFHKRRMEREMAEELAFHQEQMQQKRVAQGTPAGRAAYETRRDFGSQERWHERLRELWQFRSFEILKRDVIFSIRLLRKSPGFTAIALITLALGIGANTAVFSLVNGLLLRPLAVPHADQLAVLAINQGTGEAQYSMPETIFRGLEARHDIFSRTMAYSFKDDLLVRNQGGNENVPGAMVSGDYFAVLDVAPLLGRYLTTNDDHLGGSTTGHAVVLSEGLWNSWFNRAPGVIGRKMIIANTPYTVVGVMPKSFIGADPTQNPSLFLPLADEPIIDAPDSLTKMGFHAWWLKVVGRLQPGVALATASAGLQPISDAILRERVPDANWIADVEKHHFHFSAESGARGFTYIRSMFKKPLLALFAMCCGLLMLACINLASLLLARSAARERELATRLALGATRRRLIQQLLVESLLLGVAGTALGLIAAPLVSKALAVTLLSGTVRNLYLDTSIDLRVLGFSASLACAASLAIGLIPALIATSSSLNRQIKNSQHATQTHSQRLFPRLLLAVEVALALTLIVTAGLLATSLTRLYNSGAGFDPNGVANIAFSMDKQQLDGDALTRLYQQVGEQLGHLPGVSHVSFAWIIPLSQVTTDDGFHRSGGQDHEIEINDVAPDYFKTMRIPLVSGRDFRWTDTPNSGRKIILNQTAARLYFPNQNPVGQHLVEQLDKTDYEVVGISGDAKYSDMRSHAPATGYKPITQYAGHKPSWNAVVRSTGPAAPIAAAARALAAQLAPDIPAPKLTLLSDTVKESIATERVMATLSVFFAGCALLVAAIGLYGTLSYSTARRTSEIGVRMALGAQRSRVVALIFRENAAVALFGAGIGLAVAVAASRLLESFLYNTSARDPWILLCSVGALVVVSSAASLLPAIRASRIEPIIAIRYE